MTRSYELGFILEPRVPEDEAQALCDKFKGLITDAGATVTYVDHWGKRKLAYPIRKYSEGRYFFIYVSSDDAVSWSDIERLMMQEEKILRHLVVRTDQDLKRAYRKGKVKPEQPGDVKEEEGAEETSQPAETSAQTEKAEAAPAKTEKAEAAPTKTEKAEAAPAKTEKAEAPAETTEATSEDAPAASTDDAKEGGE